MALVSAAPAASILLFFEINSPKREIVLVFLLFTFAAGLLATLWEELFILRLDERSFELRRGCFPIRSTKSGGISEVAQVSLESDRTANLYGEIESSEVLRLALASHRITMTMEWPEVAPEDAALKIADALGQPLVRQARGPHAARTRKWIERGVQSAAWAGTLAVAIVMLIPVMRAGRSFRPMTPGGSRFGGTGWFSAGIDRYYRGDFAGAEEALRKSIDRRPNDPQVYNMLAYAEAEQNRLQEALKAAEKAVSLAPRDGNIIDTVAEMHQRLGEFELAAGLYEEALAHETPPERPESHFKYARTLLSLHRKREAIKQLQACLGLRYTPWAARARELLAELRRNDPSIKVMEPPVSIHEADPISNTYRANNGGGRLFRSIRPG